MIKLKKIKPMHSHILTTADTYPLNYSENGLTISSKAGKLREYQKVLAIGTTVRNVQEGDLVCVSYEAYIKWKVKGSGSVLEQTDKPDKVMSINIPTFPMNDTEYLYLDESDVEFVAEDYEELPDKEATVVQPLTKIVLPG